MDIRACPNCADELTVAVGGGHLHLYCQECGYEAKEVCSDTRPDPDDRHRAFDAKVVSIKKAQGKKKQATSCRVAPDRGSTARRSR